MDAAIGLVRRGEEALITNTLAESNFTIDDTDWIFDVGDEVEMYGGASGKQRGIIVDLYNSEAHFYSLAPNNVREVRFRNIVKCAYSNQKGDSGAPVILARNKRLIGMHFAGNGTHGYICRIDKVFESLRIRLAR
ncbi:MAG: hypothetical protein K2Y51_11135 [Gammaproteobacteria bacterium]|nr:hypothetical protein [Gammaproteobacteria bacterium]